MPAYQDTYFSKTFSLKESDGVTALDITAWEFQAEFRARLNDTVALLDLTTANGGLVVLDGVGGSLSMRITAVQTGALPVGKLVFDVLRTDASPGPVYLFSGTLPVKKPVTRP